MIKSLFYLALSIFFIGCSTHYHVDDANYDRYQIQISSQQVDSSMEALLIPYRTEMEKEMNEVLAISTADMQLGKPESKLGNFAADATEYMAEKLTGQDVAFAIQNYSGLRIKTIGKGDVTLGQIYELMPFDNFLVTVQLSSEEVQQLCDFMAENGGWPSSASLTYTIMNEKAMDIRINGKELKSTGTYTLATNDYIVKSADYLPFFKSKEMHSTNTVVRDAFAEYLKIYSRKGEKFNPVLDKRVKYPSK